VDGVLVGSASLNPESFFEMISAWAVSLLGLAAQLAASPKNFIKTSLKLHFPTKQFKSDKIYLNITYCLKINQQLIIFSDPNKL
jgi:hypothetical protein